MKGISSFVRKRLFELFQHFNSAQNAYTQEINRQNRILLAIANVRCENFNNPRLNERQLTQ